MDTKNPLIINKPNLIAVEGKDEIQCFGAIAKHNNLENIQFYDLEGKDGLPKEITVLRMATNFQNVRSLGIILDADDYPDRSFQSACTALKENYLSVPRDPFVMSGAEPQVAVMILPWDRSTWDAGRCMP